MRWIRNSSFARIRCLFTVTWTKLARYEHYKYKRFQLYEWNSNEFRGLEACWRETCKNVDGWRTRETRIEKLLRCGTQNTAYFSNFAAPEEERKTKKKKWNSIAFRSFSPFGSRYAIDCMLLLSSRKKMCPSFLLDSMDLRKRHVGSHKKVSLPLSPCDVQLILRVKRERSWQTGKHMVHVRAWTWASNSIDREGLKRILASIDLWIVVIFHAVNQCRVELNFWEWEN